MARNLGITNQELVDAYVKFKLSKTKVAKHFDMTLVNLHTRLRKNKELRAAFDIAEEVRLDLAEENLSKLVKKSDLKAIKYILDRKGRVRGYGEKVEVIDKDRKKFSSVKITNDGEVLELK